MTNHSPEQVSATIYQFPLRGRFAMQDNASRFAQAAKVEIVETNGWYHTDAIKTDHPRPH
ncbi:MAG: DUF2735 domain-containing protein [Proteobacteria bacterium]|jgi:hypothetical protein|nr:MAG: DUF2735 domain-containing protein [Pseudomonadota bacterium]